MRLVRALSLLLAVAPAFAQQLASESLAPYIPSPQVLVDKMLELASVKSGDLVYDLGAGDGRIVITAARKFNARAVGIELHPDLYRATADKVKMMGLDDRVKIVHGNFLKMDLSPADVVTMYLLTNSNIIVRPNLEKYLKPGARVVSLDFEIRGWTPLVTSHVAVGGMKHKIFLYERPKEKVARK
jgi:ubiquinone/menaquinone biosynthesis C-methylase UbiE